MCCTHHNQTDPPPRNCSGNISPLRPIPLRVGTPSAAAAAASAAARDDPAHTCEQFPPATPVAPSPKSGSGAARSAAKQQKAKLCEIWAHSTQFPGGNPFFDGPDDGRTDFIPVAGPCMRARFERAPCLLITVSCISWKKFLRIIIFKMNKTFKWQRDCFSLYLPNTSIGTQWQWHDSSAPRLSGAERPRPQPTEIGARPSAIASSYNLVGP